MHAGTSTPRHIALYVTEFSLDIGDDGMRAITRLVQGGSQRGDN